MAPPPFEPEGLTYHQDRDAAYRALEEAAARGDKPQQAIWQRFQACLALIRQDGQWGEAVRSDQIPRYFQKTYGATNLYCIDLKHDVRCFYTIVGRSIVFLDIVDHAEYDKWFPPKGQKRRKR